MHGEHDPVAANILSRAGEDRVLPPPDDKFITSLFLGGLEPIVGANEVRDKFSVLGDLSRSSVAQIAAGS